LSDVGNLARRRQRGAGADQRTQEPAHAASIAFFRIKPSSHSRVDGAALESVAFAILAHQMLRGLPGNIPSVTGARDPG
jgi:1,6-anhydro-N-acetylmuramate kinase